MHVLHYILNTLNSIPSDAWGYVISVLVSAVATSPVVQIIKKWFSIDGEKKMLALTIVGSMLASAIVYLQGVPQFAPYFVLIQGWLVFATTQPVYYLFVKPLSKKLEIYFAGQIARYATVAEAKNAAVPAGGIGQAAPAGAEDFSR